MSGRMRTAPIAPSCTAARALGVAAIVMVLGLSGSRASAIDTPNERITLVDLTGVHVVFEETGDVAERQGLSRAALQPEVESRLRRAGLRVFTPTEALRSEGRPTLHVRVTLLPSPAGSDVYAYSVDLALRQRIRLVRDRALESYAITWSEHRVVGAARLGQVGVIRSLLLRKVDEFVTAWEMANRERY
jgi:hypothetical protein